MPLQVASDVIVSQLMIVPRQFPWLYWQPVLELQTLRSLPIWLHEL